MKERGKLNLQCCEAFKEQSTVVPTLFTDASSETLVTIKKAHLTHCNALQQLKEQGIVLFVVLQYSTK